MRERRRNAGPKAHKARLRIESAGLHAPSSNGCPSAMHLPI